MRLGEPSVSNPRPLTPNPQPLIPKPQPLVFLLVGLAVVGLALRIWQIDRESLWLDEAGRVAIASLPFGQIAHGVAVVELSPPLYHFVLALWIRLAGDGDVSVRLLSALLAVPAVALGWSLGRAVAGRRVGLALAALVAISPFGVHYGQEAAMYALVLPLGLATTLAAVRVLGATGSLASPSPSTGEGWGGGENLAPRPPTPDPHALSAARRARTRWLVAYVVLGTLALYTHYYAAFLLVTVVVVGVVDSVARRSRHGVIIWIAAHLLIALAFLPWVTELISQAGLAASVEDWTGIGPVDALTAWSSALFADGAVGPGTGIAVVLALAGTVLGAVRLGTRGPVPWLLVGLVIVPLVFATLSSGFFHSFRERGFIAVVAAPWLLVATAVVGARVPAGLTRYSGLDPLPRALIVAGLGFTTAAGLAWHYGQEKEDWRGAAAAVAAQAGPADPIFFVHFGAEIPFDRYFPGRQPEIGLPQSFDWSDGYHARYLVTPEDVALRVPPALAGARQAWAVLSHDSGRGSDYLVSALDRWGTRVSEQRLVGIRVLRYQIRG